MFWNAITSLVAPVAGYAGHPGIQIATGVGWIVGVPGPGTAISYVPGVDLEPETQRGIDIGSGVLLTEVGIARALGLGVERTLAGSAAAAVRTGVSAAGKRLAQATLVKVGAKAIGALAIGSVAGYVVGHTIAAQMKRHGIIKTMTYAEVDRTFDEGLYEAFGSWEKVGDLLTGQGAWWETIEAGFG